MDRHERKAKKDRTSEPDPDLVQHIQSLGLSTVEDYIAWCAQHGFSRRTDKNWRQRLKERAHANRAVAEARLAQKKQEVRTPAKVIERIFSGEIQEHNVAQPEMKAVFRAYKSAQESRLSQRAFHDLLKHVCSRSDLLSGNPVIGSYGWQAGNTYVDGLLALARHPRSWIRSVADWKPLTHNVRRQFSSLARHLFAEWPVPMFLDSVWFLGNGKGAVEQQAWFLHVGRGQNIRTANLPLPYTKRMSHHFMQAPADFTVAAALRWGQIHGLGGNDRLARAIIATRLGIEFEHDEFWTTVVQFFIANPMLDLAQVGPIIDFIQQQRFVWQDVFVAHRNRRKPKPTIKERREGA
jgi:chorismate mutase